MKVVTVNPFHVTGLFLYPVKTSENVRLSHVFMGYIKRPEAWNGLKAINYFRIKAPL